MAEGRRLLLALGCDLAQGYLISPPLPAADVVARLKSLNDALLAADTTTQQLEVLRVPTPKSA